MKDYECELSVFFLKRAMVSFRKSGDFLKKYRLTSKQMKKSTPKTANVFSEVKCVVSEKSNVPISTNRKVTRFR